MRTIDDIEIEGKRVLMRAGYDVPVKDGIIQDDIRIRASLPTISRILEKGAKQLILMAHMGRPQGRVVDGLKMDPVADKLSELLGEDVAKMNDCVDVILPDTRVVLLENVRFHTEEEEDYEFFAKKLAKYADVYVNECFSVSHRKHASLVGVTKFLPSCAGLHLAKELGMLKDKLDTPKRPFMAIVGGAKVSDKINVINNLLPKVDKLLVGGAMIFTFYKAKGYGVGKSLCEDSCVELAKLIMNNDKVVLPKDVICAEEKVAGSRLEIVSADSIPGNMYGLDIGPESVREFKEQLSTAKTVAWNGPMGLFEIEDFSKGTFEIAKHLASLDATVVIGGGDSASAIRKAGLTDKVTHVSTGGGASLKLLEGKSLVAVDALLENEKNFP